MLGRRRGSRRSVARAVGAVSGLAMLGVVAACSFGIDLDKLTTNGIRPTADGGTPADAALDVSPSLPDLVQLGAGFGFTCARRDDGRVSCWGRSTFGQLGNGTVTSSSTAALVPDLVATDLAVGAHHACAIRTGGAVSCWGNNDLGQLGTGSGGPSHIPQPTIDVPPATSLAAGELTTCAITDGGAVWCWGYNAEGELGDGTSSPRPRPTQVQGLTNAKALAMSRRTACALMASGEVWCWGYNINGEVGTGDAGADVYNPTRVLGITNASSIGSGGDSNHMCAVLTTGEARCWGWGYSGSLGDGVNHASATPVSVATLTDAVEVRTGDGVSCAIRRSGDVTCWGANDSRTLAIGDNGPQNTSTPLPAIGLSGVSAIAVGSLHACAVVQGKKAVTCWGADLWGATGRGRALTSDVPVLAATSTTFAKIAVGREHVCAADADGGVFCWGNNIERQQGRAEGSYIGVPTRGPSFADVTSLAAGDLHSCIVGSDGVVRCWGDDGYGALGNAPPTSTVQPTVFVASPAATVGAGNYVTCALLRDSTIACSGFNGDGRLGRPDVASTNVPLLVIGGTDPDSGAPVPFSGATALYVGTSHACAIHDGGAHVACWGRNVEGELGIPGGGTLATPQNVPLSGPPMELALGAAHTCAILVDGTVACWGRNSHGEVSGGAPGGEAIRTVNLGGKHAVHVAAGDDHTCAVLEDGTVACWGAGVSGQLGNGARIDAFTPVPTKGLSGVTAISANADHTCALSRGATWCWGTDFSGELGVAPAMTSGIPAPVQ